MTYRSNAADFFIELVLTPRTVPSPPKQKPHAALEINPADKRQASTGEINFTTIAKKTK